MMGEDDQNNFKIKSGPLAGKRVVFAEQNKLKFVSEILDDFLSKVLNHPEAWVSDESRISDFADFGEDSKGFRLEIIEKTKNIYGVDISSVFNEYLSVVMHYIEANSIKNNK